MYLMNMPYGNFESTKNNYTIGEERMLTDMMMTFNKPEYDAQHRFMPIDIIFNGPATIILWEDGSKTVVKCGKNDVFNKEAGIALCYMKKALGNTGFFNEILKEYAYDEDKES